MSMTPAPVSRSERLGGRRIALLTTGLRPVALGFAALPQRPVGIIQWDTPAARSVRSWLQTVPLLSDAIAWSRGRRYPSLPRLCARNGLQFADVDKRRPDDLAARLKAWDIDLVITSGCAMVPMSALAEVPLGAINLHPSLLPRWRGPDPLLWQLLHEEPRFGVTVHRLADGSDTGAVLGQQELADRPRGASRQTLTDALEGELGLPLLARVIDAVCAGDARETPQPATSPTPYARRVASDELDDIVAPQTLDAQARQDVIAFLGTRPDGW